MTSLVYRFCFHQLFYFLSIGIFVPIMSLFFLDKGLTLHEVGICITMFFVMLFLLELPTGGLADQIGRKKVFLLSTSINIIAVVVLMCAEDRSPLLFVGNGLMGMARSLSSGTIDAWFVDRFNVLAPKGNLQKAFAKVGVFAPLGVAIGSLLGGILPGFSSALGWERYSLNLVTMLFAYSWISLYTIIWIDEPTEGFDSKILNSFRNLPNVLKESFHFGIQNRSLSLLFAAMLCWALAVSSVETFWQPQVKWILGSEEQSWIFGLLATGYFAAAATGNLFITRICRLFKNNYALVLITFRLTMGLSLLILARQTTIIGFGFFYLFMFFQNGFLKSPHQSLFHQQVPSDKRSTLVSIDSLFLSIGGMIGNSGLGWFADNYSIPIAWYISSAVFCGSALLYFFYMRLNAVPIGVNLEK